LATERGLTHFTVLGLIQGKIYRFEMEE